MDRLLDEVQRDASGNSSDTFSARQQVGTTAEWSLRSNTREQREASSCRAKQWRVEQQLGGKENIQEYGYTVSEAKESV